MSRVLIHGGSLYSQGNPGATSMIVVDDRIVWIGDRVSASGFVADVDAIIDCGDAFIAPGFVDAHVHLSSTGLHERGVNLVGVSSATQALSVLADYCASSSDDIVMGHGWDDTDWSDGELWTSATIRERVGERSFYVTRIDVHSAIASVNFTSQVAATTAGWSDSGIFSQESHHEVRDVVLRQLSSQQRRAAITSALSSAASHGIVAVHEYAGPHVSGEADFLDVLELLKADSVPQVFAYWGDVDLERVQRLGAFGAAGDLTVDGSCGSHTAFMQSHYSDNATLGAQYLSAEQIGQHLASCTRIGLQGGFHAIGDGALENIRLGLELAIKDVGIEAMRKSRHRVEHAELLTATQIAAFAHSGIVLSVQPVFDELWGGTGGMYDQRLGSARMEMMNPFAQVISQGIPVAFGSDSPVTPIDPWRAMRAATMHHTAVHRISARAAFSAHTRGGWRAVGDDESGVLVVGAPAHFAVWNVEDLEVTVPDGRAQTWSTDERSGTPGLPNLEGKLPECLLTVRNGKPIYDSDSLWQHSVD